MLATMLNRRRYLKLSSVGRSFFHFPLFLSLSHCQVFVSMRCPTNQLCGANRRRHLHSQYIVQFTVTMGSISALIQLAAACLASQATRHSHLAGRNPQFCKFASMLHSNRTLPVATPGLYPLPPPTSSPFPFAPRAHRTPQLPSIAGHGLPWPAMAGKRDVPILSLFCWLKVQ